MGYPTKSGASVTSDTALNIATVYACVQLISGIIARLPVRILQTTSAGCDIVTDHPAGRLLQQTPDGYRTPFAWRQMLEMTALLRGNGPARIFRNSYFEPEKLGWMNPLQFEIWRTPDGDPYYRYRGQILQLSDVLVHKEMSTDGVTGMSPITAMREALGLAMTTQEHASRFFSNGAQPGIVLMAPLGTTKDQMDRIRDEINKNHGGVANSNKPFVAYGGLAPTVIPLNNADSQFLESRRFDVEEIARAYRVPPHLIGATDKTTSWGTGIEQQTRAFLDFSIGDRLVRMEQEFNLALLSKADRDAGIYCKFDTAELTKGTALERAQAYQIHRNIGTMSVNDVREAEGMNDLPDNIGDRYDLPFNGNGGTNAEAASKDSQQKQKNQPEPANK